MRRRGLLFLAGQHMAQQFQPPAQLSFMGAIILGPPYEILAPDDIGIEVAQDAFQIDGSSRIGPGMGRVISIGEKNNVTLPAFRRHLGFWAKSGHSQEEKLDKVFSTLLNAEFDCKRTGYPELLCADSLLKICGIR